jgi:hypothetical protein
MIGKETQMKDIAGDAVRATQVGKRGVMKPDSDTADSLAEFQAAELEADRLTELGVITVHQKHRESITARHYIDFISFTRLR